MNTTPFHRFSGLVLGLDYGRKWIGVAIGETVTGSCRPLRSIQAHNPDAVWGELASLIEEWNPRRIILGLPYHLDGSEGELSTEIRSFGARLQRQSGCTVEFWNEALTTESARHQLSGKNLRRGQASSRGLLNASAAREILSGWISQHAAS